MSRLTDLQAEIEALAADIGRRQARAGMTMAFDADLDAARRKLTELQAEERQLRMLSTPLPDDLVAYVRTHGTPQATIATVLALTADFLDLRSELRRDREADHRDRDTRRRELDQAIWSLAIAVAASLAISIAALAIALT